MIRWIGDFFNFLTAFFSWFSFLFSINVFIIHLLKFENQRKLGFKDWFVLVISGTYPIAFLVCRLAFPDFFETFWGVVVVAIFFISASMSRSNNCRYNSCRRCRGWWRY